MKINEKSVRTLIGGLADVIRAENIISSNYLELYVGENSLESIDNVNNQTIYGRRGSGKTHLLKALQEKINENFEVSRRLSIYIDARNILPLINSSVTTPEESALLIFQGIIQSIVDAFSINVRLIFGRDHIITIASDVLDQDALKNISQELKKLT
ncbi:Cdc6-like AAA superfamily ATPase [Polaromonas sp. CG_9.5]|uniref:ORC-CDC6 family AAA ATPase n=1 Tax=Polaromonas sp. CG_9.5 TaxID=3071705 RepID=UPI002E004045|nr:Cdc6-like AAA superfamily ATPase [Polaromonas sp. CG_9.5]